MNLRSENCMSHVSLPWPLLDIGRNIGFSYPEPLSLCTLRSLAWPFLSSLPVSHSKCLLLLQHFISVLLKHIPGYHIFYPSGVPLLYVLIGWFFLRLLEGLHFWWDYCLPQYAQPVWGGLFTIFSKTHFPHSSAQRLVHKTLSSQITKDYDWGLKADLTFYL